MLERFTTAAVRIAIAAVGGAVLWLFMRDAYDQGIRSEYEAIRVAREAEAAAGAARVRDGVERRKREGGE